METKNTLDIKERNKVIAEFMGWKLKSRSSSIGGRLIYYFEDKDGDQWYGLSDSSCFDKDSVIGYNSDWNLLMDAVRKIHQEGFDVRMGLIQIKFPGTYCNIEDFDGQNCSTIVEIYRDDFDLLNTVFLAVSDFCLNQLKK
jgi:hypothetical protein